MNKRDLAKFKKLLLEERNTLDEEIRHLEKDNLNTSQRDAAGDLSGYTLHMADLGTDSFQREINMGLVTNEHKLMHEIEEALQRIKEGTYGRCTECEGKIKRARLEAIPHARFCISCQEKKEGEGANSGSR